MTGRPGRSSWLWVMVLLAAAGTFCFGASPARARTAPPEAGPCLPPLCPTSSSSSSTTSSTSSTSTSTTSTTTVTSTTVAAPTTVPGSPYSVGFLPCGPDSNGECSQEPTQVELHYAGTGPAAVQLSWQSAGRASGAPAPPTTTVGLPWSTGAGCGSGLRCWPWPAQMTDSSYVLNGTYQLEVCESYSQGNCQTTSPSVTIKLAAPPGPPTHVQARSSGNQVDVTWQPPTGAPPDLVGYAVARDGRALYSCSTDGLGPAASVACPSSLSAMDRPGNGSFTYTVSAMRLGATTDAANVVPSAAAGAGSPVTVPGAVTTPADVNTGRAAGAMFTPAPVIGGSGSVVPGVSAVSSGRPSLAGPAAAGTAASPVAGAPANLQYPSDDPVVGRSALGVKVGGGRSKPDVVPAGMVALAILILTIAGHFLYLRAEVGRLQARLVAARRRPA